MYNVKLFLDEDGYCRLCSGKGEHRGDCPGALFENLRYQVSFIVRSCGRGCCPGYSGTLEGDTIEGLVPRMVSIASDAENGWSADLNYIATVPSVDIEQMVIDSKTEQRKAAEAEEKAREAERELRSNTASFWYELRKLKQERTDLLPEAYDRRHAELLKKYCDLGVDTRPVGVPTEE